MTFFLKFFMPAHGGNLRYTEIKKFQFGSRVVATKHAARFVLHFFLYSCVIVFGLTAAGCDDFSFYDLLDADTSNVPTGEFTINPLGMTLIVGEQATFTAVNGTPPYTFVVLSGSGSIDETSGLFTAPNTPGTSIIRVIDSTGATNDAQVIIVE